ncbi:MAG: PLD nuclease N-terminal domain-containing protein [Boseongicola sp.]|nr:PLD nuclease N-terminal domain-containing protein [Boseongicola sp.]MDD9978844.1 PLD nuclease N-terminal domain-containing protein [Boseongicola sp.]
MIDYLGLYVLIAWTFAVWAFWDVIRSGSSVTKKLTWTILLLVPVIGFLAWFLLGPRANATKKAKSR